MIERSDASRGGVDKSSSSLREAQRLTLPITQLPLFTPTPRYRPVEVVYAGERSLHERQRNDQRGRALVPPPPGCRPTANSGFAQGACSRVRANRMSQRERTHLLTPRTAATDFCDADDGIASVLRTYPSGSESRRHDRRWLMFAELAVKSKWLREKSFIAPLEHDDAEARHASRRASRLCRPQYMLSRQPLKGG